MTRRNPPLEQHLAEERLSDLSRGLGQRLYDDPSEGAEFVRDLLLSVASGLGDREAVGEYEKKREIGEHLHEAWRHLNAALAYMHPRRNPRTIREVKESREYKRKVITPELAREASADFAVGDYVSFDHKRARWSGKIVSKGPMHATVAIQSPRQGITGKIPYPELQKEAPPRFAEKVAGVDKPAPGESLAAWQARTGRGDPRRTT